MARDDNSGGMARYDWADPFFLESELTDDERMIRDTAARLRPGQAGAPRRPRLRQRTPRAGDLSRDGGDRPAWPHGGGGIWRGWRGLRRLRPDRARGRAGRLRLPLDDERAILARHVPDRGVRVGRAEAPLPAQAGDRRVRWLLRPDRTRRRLRPRRDADHGQEDRRRFMCSTGPRPGSAIPPSPTCSWCGRSPTRTAARSGASCWKRA